MNKENTGISKAYCLLIMMSAVLILPVDAVALDIHDITISETKYQLDGVPGSALYEFSCGVRGNDIGGVIMETPGGDIYNLVPWPTAQYDWGFCRDGLTQAELLAKFPNGDYGFVFNGWIDHVTLTHNPTAPTGFANITYPVHNSYNVPLSPTITWGSCAGYGDALSMALFEMPGDIMVDSAHWVPIETTTWTVGPLTSGLLHLLEVSVFTGTTPSAQSTANLDDFNYYNLYENCKEISFTTIPAIGTLSGWVFMPVVPGDGYAIGYSIDEMNWLYFFSYETTWSYHIFTGNWVPFRPEGWIYVDWPYYYRYDTNTLWFALPPESGLWVYHFSNGQWVILPRIIP